jgi:hypothetical protein
MGAHRYYGLNGSFDASPLRSLKMRAGVSNMNGAAADSWTLGLGRS